MSSTADWTLLALGVFGFGVAAYLSLHFFTHRDRRRANRRSTPGRRGKGRRDEDH